MPYFGVWSSFSLGSLNLEPWRLLGPGNLLFGIFGILGFDSNIADKFLIIWPWVILSGVSSFLLVKKITKSDIGSLIGSFVFSCNTYFLAINTQGHLLLSIASVFSVFAFLFFIKFIETKKTSFSIVTALFLFLVGISDLRMAYLALLVLFIYALYFLFIIKDISDYKQKIKWLLITLKPIILFFVLNIFWIIPSIKSGYFTENSILSRTLFGSNFYDLTKAITLFHPFWSGGELSWFVIQPIPIFFWLIPIVAFLGLILNIKDKYIIFFGLLSLLGVFLSKQAGLPFRGFYGWLFNNFPGFNAFREASKFYFITAIGYSVLIGVSINWLWKNFNKNKKQVYFKYSLTFFIAILLLWNAKPLITNEIKSMFVSKEIPNDYLVFRKNIANENKYFRILWVPRYSRWGTYTDRNPSMSNIDIIADEWGEFINYGYYKDRLIRDEIMDVFRHDFSNQLFNISSVRYISIPIQDKDNNDDFFVYYGGQNDLNIREWYIQEFDNIKWLERIYIGTEKLVIYENKNYKDHIYITKEQETIYKNLDFTIVDWQRINSAKYYVSIKNIKEKEYLNFSERYHDDWNIGVGKFGWFDALIGSNYFIDKKYHIKNDAGLNSFLIDPDYIKQNFPKQYYKENDDGSIDIELSIYFGPQSYFYLGLIISGITMFGCFGYLGYSFIKRRKKIFKK
jgi:hypothetical protein